MAWMRKGKVTRRERFLAEMDAVIPWARLIELIEPHYPKAGAGRQPVGTVGFRQDQVPGLGQEPGASRDHVDAGQSIPSPAPTVAERGELRVAKPLSRGSKLMKAASRPRGHLPATNHPPHCSSGR